MSRCPTMFGAGPGQGAGQLEQRASSSGWAAITGAGSPTKCRGGVARVTHSRRRGGSGGNADAAAIMSDGLGTAGLPGAGGTSTAMQPSVVDRTTWQSQLDALLIREKAHTRAGDAIAAARRRLPMVEVDAAIPVIGEHGPVPLLEVFEGRSQLIVYFDMWHAGHPAAAQCEGCTFFNGQETWEDSPPG